MESDAGRSFFSTDTAEKELNEDALRQALGRMGSRPAPTAGSARHTPEPRRRRFVQDGQILVEHHQPSRHAQRNAASPAATSENNTEIERLKNLVKIEQRRSEDSQRQLHDVQHQVRLMQTRIAHADLRLKELQDTVEERDARIGALLARLAAKSANQDERGDDGARKPRLTLPAEAPKRGRPPSVQRVRQEEPEPEPVKWWIKA
jgi:septal ring factor EnvC (AmiA/AmiB activator)